MTFMELTDKNIVKRAVFKRPYDANKGTMGSLLCICGSYSMAGAAIMAEKAALRCGIGLLKCALPKSIYPIAAQSVFEGVYFPLDETSDGKISSSSLPLLLEQSEKSKCVLIGCGMSVCDDTQKIVNEFVCSCKVPMVLDADALNCVAKNPDILKFAKSPVIVTPHPGEMARLEKKTVAEVNASRIETAKQFADEYGAVTVLKGAGTVIAAPHGQIVINQTGNSGMATGGSGDVLAGMTASLFAQGANAFDSAAAAVYLHGLAGDIAKEKFGKISMLPTDIIDCIPKAFKECGF